MNKKVTAVEWLEKELKERYPLINSEPLFEQAKEMEKEQMKEVAWYFREVDMKKSNKGNIIDLEFNEYYNETYGK
jgi:hypothetical protein